MKRYSKEWVWEWLQKQGNNWMGITAGGQPAPFPGKYPTRIAYRVEKEIVIPKKREVVRVAEYVGKPSLGALRRLDAVMRGLPNETLPLVTVAEFDTKKVVSITTGRFAFQPRTIWTPGFGVAMSYRNRELRAFYHPWEREDMHLIPVRVWAKRLVKRNKRWMVYSPLERLRIETHINPWRAEAMRMWPKLGVRA